MVLFTKPFQASSSWHKLCPTCFHKLKKHCFKNEWIVIVLSRLKRGFSPFFVNKSNLDGEILKSSWNLCAKLKSLSQPNLKLFPWAWVWMSLWHDATFIVKCPPICNWRFLRAKSRLVLKACFLLELLQYTTVLTKRTLPVSYLCILKTYSPKRVVTTV